MINMKRTMQYLMVFVLFFLIWFATIGKSSVSTYVKSQFSPESIVNNAGDHPILIVIDRMKGQYSGPGVHTIVELPPKTSTMEIGIDDPEGILLHKDAYRDNHGIIRAKESSQTLKTPAGSLVHISGTNQKGLIYETEVRGFWGIILTMMGIHPKYHDSRHFVL